MRQPRKPKVPKKEWEHGFAYSQTFEQGKAANWEDYPKRFDDATGCFLQMFYFIYRRFKAGKPVAVFYQLYLKGDRYDQDANQA